MNDFLECAKPKRRYRTYSHSVRAKSLSTRIDEVLKRLEHVKLSAEPTARDLVITLINSLGGCLSERSTDAEIAREARFAATKVETDALPNRKEVA